MNNFMKTIISAVQTWTKGKIKESTADWNENDSNSNNYVKNRTHYDTRRTEKIVYTFDGNLEGKETVLGFEDGGIKNYMVKISDDYVSADKWIGAIFSVYTEEKVFNDIEITEDVIIDMGDGNLDIDGTIACFATDFEIPNGPIFTPGIWIICRVDEAGTPIVYVQSIERYEEIGELKHLDSKFIKDMYYDNGTIVTELAPLQTIDNFGLMDNSIYCSENPFSINLEKGAAYVVNWDGDKYELVCDQYDGLNYIGNVNYVFMNTGGDIPFAVLNADENTFVATESTEESHEISITEYKRDLKQVDFKYLPIVEDISEIVFERDDIFSGDNDFEDPEYKKLVGKHEVIINGNSKIVEFVNAGDYSYVYTNSFEIETWDGGIWLGIWQDTEEAHTVKIISNVNKIAEKYLPDDIGSQADWDQNDENGPGYINNRTHYIADKELLFSETLIPESEFRNGYYYACADWCVPSNLPDNYYIIVNFDGTDYFSGKPRRVEGFTSPVVGDVLLKDTPFCVETYGEPDFWYFLDNNEHQVSVYVCKVNILPEYYLPEFEKTHYDIRVPARKMCYQYDEESPSLMTYSYDSLGLLFDSEHPNYYSVILVDTNDNLYNLGKYNCYKSGIDKTINSTAGFNISKNEYYISNNYISNYSSHEFVIKNNQAYIQNNTIQGHNVKELYISGVFDGGIKYLDEKYIPDSIARVADIPAPAQADMSETDDTSASYIKNKTHYYWDGLGIDRMDTFTVGWNKWQDMSDATSTILNQMTYDVQTTASTGPLVLKFGANMLGTTQIKEVWLKDVAGIRYEKIDNVNSRYKVNNLIYVYFITDLTALTEEFRDVFDTIGLYVNIASETGVSGIAFLEIYLYNIVKLRSEFLAADVARVSDIEAALASNSSSEEWETLYDTGTEGVTVDLITSFNQALNKTQDRYKEYRMTLSFSKDTSDETTGNKTVNIWIDGYKASYYQISIQENYIKNVFVHLMPTAPCINAGNKAVLDTFCFVFASEPAGHFVDKCTMESSPATTNGKLNINILSPFSGTIWCCVQGKK